MHICITGYIGTLHSELLCFCIAGSCKYTGCRSNVHGSRHGYSCTDTSVRASVSLLDVYSATKIYAAEKFYGKLFRGSYAWGMCLSGFLSHFGVALIMHLSM